MKCIRVFSVFFCGLAVATMLSASASAATIAYFNNNSNSLPLGTGLFGYQPGDFPQPADVGVGTLNLGMFDSSTETDASGNLKYTYIESFAGTTVNAQFAAPAGGSLSPEGGSALAAPAVGFANNGMKVLYNMSTLGFEDIKVSWAQRGTSSGFTSRAFAYSTDGVNFTPVAYTGDSGVLSATYTAVAIDLSAISALDNQPLVTFQVTLNGATSANGNNRFDNMFFEGTVLIPEPATLALAGLAMAGAVAMRRRG